MPIHALQQERRFGVPPLEILFGRTAEMGAVRRKLESVAKTRIPVLIQGESGTGKEFCVRLIHGISERPADSLVKVSCPAIPASLVETELFGYEKGSFTGANATKRGRVEQANGGTLFLDEVGSLEMAVQSKLLQVLQDGTFMRVGAHETRTIETRLVSVANRELQEQVEEGSFRLDFLYRINAITLDVPPLRNRLGDLPTLVEYMMGEHAHMFQVKPTPLSSGALRQMRQYGWPGNLRQLDNLIRSYVLLGSEEALLADLVEEEKIATKVTAEVDVSSPIALKALTKKATQELERQVILKVLKANDWNRVKTAKWLQISYRSLLYKLHEVEATGVVKRRRGNSVGKAAAGSSASPLQMSTRIH